MKQDKKVIESENINTFKARLEFVWKNKMTKFSIETPIDRNEHEWFEQFRSDIKIFT